MTAEERLAKRLEGRINPFDWLAIKGCAEPNGKERHDYGLYATAVTLFEELLRLERESEWVKVSERLPERGKDVLVCVNGDVEIDQLHKDSGTWLIFMDDAVTHWRPLPAAPGEE